MMILATIAAATMMTGAQDRAPQLGGPERVAPRGSYAQSCSGEYVNQGRLYADCQDMRGRLRGTSIELARCTNSNIGNSDGLLVCGNVRGDYEDRGGGGGGRPDRPGRPGGGNDGGWGDGGGWGGGRNSITVYRDNGFRGASASFQGEVGDLRNSGFSDSISSMEFRGEWEACTDAYFRGYCQTFRDNVRNLDRWGMNDRISSIRPVRGGGRGW